MTREMAKAFKVGLLNLDIVKFQWDEPNSFLSTLAYRVRILEQEQPNSAKEIKKVVDLRLQRNQWITKCRAYRFRNVEPTFGIPIDLCPLNLPRLEKW